VFDPGRLFVVSVGWQEPFVLFMKFGVAH